MPGIFKVSEILRLLALDGWVEVRSKGSHRQLRHPVKPGIVTVAGKPSMDLHPDTVKSIARQAGLTLPEKR
jgi:predicted RNA binding protein YcfA (HicA-like mRNA interferase family)